MIPPLPSFLSLLILISRPFFFKHEFRALWTKSHRRRFPRISHQICPTPPWSHNHSCPGPPGLRPESATACTRPLPGRRPCRRPPREEAN